MTSSKIGFSCDIKSSFRKSVDKKLQIFTSFFKLFFFTFFEFINNDLILLSNIFRSQKFQKFFDHKFVGISALHLNISSLSKHIDSLGNMLEQLTLDFNVIVISETRITQDAIPHNLENPNYKCVSTKTCLLYTSPSPRDGLLSRMPSSA